MAASGAVAATAAGPPRRRRGLALLVGYPLHAVVGSEPAQRPRPQFATAHTRLRPRGRDDCGDAAAARRRFDATTAGRRFQLGLRLPATRRRPRVGGRRTRRSRGGDTVGRNGSRRRPNDKASIGAQDAGGRAAPKLARCRTDSRGAAGDRLGPAAAAPTISLGVSLCATAPCGRRRRLGNASRGAASRCARAGSLCTDRPAGHCWASLRAPARRHGGTLLLALRS